jgi:epoxide hydrolase
VPLALAGFAGDFASIRPFAERDHSNIVSWNTYDEGGHYAPNTVPEAYAADVAGFFVSLG